MPAPRVLVRWIPTVSELKCGSFNIHRLSMYHRALLELEIQTESDAKKICRFILFQLAY